MTVIYLDADQRAALRAELALDASAFADLGVAIRCGDRGNALALRAHLDLVIGALDAIGWTDGPDAPDASPVRDVVALATYADARLPELDAPATFDRRTTAPAVVDRALVIAHALRAAQAARHALATRDDWSGDR